MLKYDIIAVCIDSCTDCYVQELLYALTLAVECNRTSTVSGQRVSIRGPD